MPEGDTIYRAARTLDRALSGQPVIEFRTVLPQLSRIDVDLGVVGRTVVKVEPQGKWMLIYFSNDLILLTHMLMSGSWHIYRPGEKWQRPAGQMRIVIATEKMVAVAFTVPIAEFHSGESLRRRAGFHQLGARLLNEDFDEREAVDRFMQRKDLEVGIALLTQSVLAGIGNVYKSEVCFTCNVNPFRKVASLSLEEARCLVSTARRLLLANVAETSSDSRRRTTGRSHPEERLWVYQRKGEPCRKCGAPIKMQKQGSGARSTFWCSQCQLI